MEGTTGTMTTMLEAFSEVAAWMWGEVVELLAMVINQPILLISMSLFFIGAIIAMFIRIYHSF